MQFEGASRYSQVPGQLLNTAGERGGMGNGKWGMENGDNHNDFEGLSLESRIKKYGNSHPKSKIDGLMPINSLPKVIQSCSLTRLARVWHRWNTNLQRSDFIHFFECIR
jgi:hypothetical protein